ncbi:MAG: hypothetical protein JWP89_7126 [Schlesneria sp.]|nr:hypothetical protein [Schlesneria sp.]
MAKEKAKLCVYCGNKATTRDHIPPKCLFPDPLPSDLITVPACHKCNAGESKDDEYFRARIVAKNECGSHKAAQQVAVKLFRSFERVQNAGFTRDFIDSIKDFDLCTPSGIYLGKATGYDVDHDRMLRVVRRIMIGLHFKEFGRGIPKNFEATVQGRSNVDPTELSVLKEVDDWVKKIVSKRKPKRIGDGVFAYTYVSPDDRPDVTAWAMEFYESEVYLGFCIPRNARPRAPQPY